MMKQKTNKQQEDYSSMVNGNTILLSLDGWIKFIEGFTKGLQTTDKVNSAAVLDCVGEILEGMVTFKTQITNLFLHCEKILQENEQLKKDVKMLPKNITTIEDTFYEIEEDKINGKDL